MKKLLLILSFGLLFCLSFGVAAQENEPVYVVMEIDGEASVKFREGGRSRLSVGAILRSDDIIEVDALSSVTVLCADMKVDFVEGVSRTPNCTPNVPEVIWDWNGKPIVDLSVRRGSQVALYILSPRNSALLYGNPSFAWTAVPDAAKYTLTVSFADGTVVWEKGDLTTNTIDYPADQDYLRALDNAGKPLEYQIKIQAFDSNGQPIASRPDTGIVRSIRVLPPGERTAVEQILGSLEAAVPARNIDDAKAYTQALYLYRSGLYTDALTRLHALLDVPLNEEFSADDIAAENLRSSPYLYTLLGDVYMQTRLLSEAALAYQRALTLATTLEDLRGAAINDERLGFLSRLSNAREDAAAHYESALAAYTELGDNEAIERVTTELEALQ